MFVCLLYGLALAGLADPHRLQWPGHKPRGASPFKDLCENPQPWVCAGSTRRLFQAPLQSRWEGWRCLYWLDWKPQSGGGEGMAGMSRRYVSYLQQVECSSTAGSGSEVWWSFSSTSGWGGRRGGLVQLVLRENGAKRRAGSRAWRRGGGWGGGQACVAIRNKGIKAEAGWRRAEPAGARRRRHVFRGGGDTSSCFFSAMTSGASST